MHRNKNTACSAFLIFNKKKKPKRARLGIALQVQSHKFFKMGIALKFVERTTPNGNLVKEAKINGTLKSLSPKSFSYINGSGDTVEYKLATIEFLDENQEKKVANQVHVYKSSYEEGMEIGQTYLGSVTRSTDADGKPRSPWLALSSFVVGAQITDDMFEDYVAAGDKAQGV